MVSKRDLAMNGLAAAIRSKGVAELQLLIEAVARLEAKVDFWVEGSACRLPECIPPKPVPLRPEAPEFVPAAFQAGLPDAASEVERLLSALSEPTPHPFMEDTILGWLAPTTELPSSGFEFEDGYGALDGGGNLERFRGAAGASPEPSFSALPPSSGCSETLEVSSPILVKDLDSIAPLTEDLVKSPEVLEVSSPIPEEGSDSFGTLAEDPANSEGVSGDVSTSFRCARCGDHKEEVELHWNEFVSWGGGVCDLCAEELQPEHYAVSHTPEADDEHKRRVASYSTSRPSCSAFSVTQDPSPPTVSTGTRTGKKRGRKKPKRTSQQVTGMEEDRPVGCMAADNSIEELLKSLTANGSVLAAFVEDLDSGRAVTDDEMAESCHSVLTGLRNYLETDGANREVLETWVHQLERLTPIIYARGRQPI